MGISKKIYSLANLGAQTALHFVKYPFVGQNSKGLAKFIENYSEDCLTYIAEEELPRLPALENCIACRACDLVCPICEGGGESAFRPSFIAYTASRSMPELRFAEELIKHFSVCQTCDACANACPQKVDFRAAREFIAAHHNRLKRC